MSLAVRQGAVGAVLFSAVLLAGPAPAAAERIVLQTKDKGITVYQEQSWDRCSETVRFNVRSPSSAVFEGDRVQLQKVLGGLRAITAATCPRMTAMDVVGKVNGATVFEAIIRKSNDWRLAPKATGQTTQEVHVDEPGDVGPSDSSAASLEDQQRFLDLLAEPGVTAEEPPSGGFPTPVPDARSPAPTAPPLPPLPTADVNDTELRDFYAYRKLMRSFEGVLGLPGPRIVDQCSELSLDQAQSVDPSISDLLFRLCRAAAFASKDFRRANRIDEIISKRSGP